MWERGGYFRKEVEELMDEIQGKDGEWSLAPEFLGCCDCGLVHRMEYSYSIDDETGVVNVFVRSFRDKKLTEKAREEKNFVCSIKKEEK